jgi:FKBP-type peptidyl-prolyl cis-trans isomerase
MKEKSNISVQKVKTSLKFILKWLLIALIIFFFVGGTVISAWMSNKDAKQAEKKKKEEQSNIQKQIEEYQKKAKQDAEKPKEIDPNFKVDSDIIDLKIIDEKTGDGPEVKLGNKIKVKYKLGLASSGEIEEENKDGVEFELKEGSLIKGWTEGIPGMKVGGIRRLEIPSDKAYGEQGNTSIPGNSDLVFTVELLEVK